MLTALGSSHLLERILSATVPLHAVTDRCEFTVWVSTLDLHICPSSCYTTEYCERGQLQKYVAYGPCCRINWNTDGSL